MTVSVAQASSVAVTSSSTTSVGVSLPSGPTSGNILVVLVCVDKNAGTWTPPSGFTTRQSVSAASMSMLMATKTSDGSETGTLTTSWSNARPNKAIVMEITGTGTISYDSSASNNTETAGTSLATGTASTGADAAFAVTLWGNDSAKASPGDPDPTGSWTNSITTYAEEWTASAGVGEPGFVCGTGPAAASSSVSSTYSHDGNSDQMAAGIIVIAETGGGGGGSSNGPMSGPLKGPTGGFV